MQKLLILLLFPIILFSCNTGEQDYTYTIANYANEYSPITVVYTVLDGNKDTIQMEYGEELKIAERLDVSGKKIWNIETSVSLYKIKSIKVASFDSSAISSELSYRRFWTGPESVDGKGDYKLNITDSEFLLHKQENYTYVLRNQLPTPLIVKYGFSGGGRFSDTLIAPKNHILGSKTIYTYLEDQKNSPQYKIQKISGLSHIALQYNNKQKNINLSKDTMYFEAKEDTCYITITENIFN